MTIDTQLATLAALQAHLDERQATHAAARLAALTPAVRQRLRDLDACYAMELEGLEAQIAAQTLQVKAAVLAHGHSVQGHGLQAVYVHGRTQWNTEALVGYATTHAEILAFQRTGPPSVSLRTTPQKEG